MIPLTESQRQAVAARGNVIVVAGAGTGKTSTLVERCLALLEEGTSLENILMVTFTDAAAAEMRSRIREALRAKASLLQADDANGGQGGVQGPSRFLPPHPGPLPLGGGEGVRRTGEGDVRGEGNYLSAQDELESARLTDRLDKILPVPGGEGRGEGEGSVRSPAGSGAGKDWSATQRLREHFEKQLALLDVAHISTLHSVCLQLAREHFYELGIDPEVTVLDETQSRPLIRQALDAIFERHYASETEAAKAVQSLVRVHGRGSDDGIRALVLRLHRYTQSLPHPERWLADQRALFRAPEPAQWQTWFLEGFVNWANLWRPALESFTSTPAVKLCRQALIPVPPDASLTEIAMTIRALRAADADPDNWPSGSKTAVRSRLKGFFADIEFLESLLPSAEKDPLREDWEFVRQPMLTLLALTQEFTAEFSRAKRALGGVDFADLEQFALRLLRDSRTGELTLIARDWRERLHYLFVDEYQDINGVQDAILTALSRDGERGNRFLVGDVKQSIYRFRLANPSIFRAYEAQWRDRTAQACRISLADNFRSRGPILDFVNALFGSLMRPEIGGVNYEALNPGRIEEMASSLPSVVASPASSASLPLTPAFSLGEREHPGVEFHLIAKDDDENEDIDAGDEDVSVREDLADLQATEREARLVALRLLELQRQGHRIWDPSEKKFRQVQWSDMAVLLRSPAGKVEAFAMEFNRVGVPLQVARASFFQCLEVSDLHCLLKVIDNPLQDIPLLAVLRSPFVGLSLEELGEIRAHNREPSFWLTLRRFHREGTHRSSSSPPGRGEGVGSWGGIEETAASAWEKTDSFLRQFENWRELIRHTSLSNCLEAALAETHYEALLLVEARGEQREANVRRFVDLARQYDPYQRQGLFRFLRFVAEQEDSESDFEPASALTENAVRLSSIHKSKGLEFPVVVVAGLGWRFNFRDLNKDILLDPDYGLCPKVTPPEGEQRYPSLPCWLARQRQRRELLGEEMRLLYVATTRARDTLILTATAPRKTDLEWFAEVSRLSATCYLDWIQAWLQHATRTPNDRDQPDRSLRWMVYSETDSRFSLPPVVGQASSLPVREASCLAKDQSRMPGQPACPDDSVLRQLSGRLAWQYPFWAASEERAKTSVTQLQRRGEDDESESQAAPFIRRNAFGIPAKQGRSLSAADIGAAHHLFLQHLDLRIEPTLEFLRREADRLAESRRLSAEQRQVLDLESVAAFWNSDVGRKIRAADASALRRELPFTARFSPGVLQAVGLPVSSELGEDEWVIVQGVVDLAAILPGELWLIDFKTDDLRPADVAAKVEQHRPQVQLYAHALAQIYRRPVSERWLHFLKLRKTISVEAAKDLNRR